MVCRVSTNGSGLWFLCVCKRGYLYIYICHVFFTHSSFDGHFHCFPYLGYCEEHCSEHGSTGISLRSCLHFLQVYIPRNGIGGLFCSSIFWGTSILFLHCGFVPIYTPTNSVHAFISTFLSLMMATLTGVRCYLILVHDLHFLMIDVGHICMYLLAICTPSLKRMSIQFCPHF